MTERRETRTKEQNIKESLLGGLIGLPEDDRARDFPPKDLTLI